MRRNADVIVNIRGHNNLCSAASPCAIKARTCKQWTPPPRSSSASEQRKFICQVHSVSVSARTPTPPTHPARSITCNNQIMCVSGTWTRSSKPLLPVIASRQTARVDTCAAALSLSHPIHRRRNRQRARIYSAGQMQPVHRWFDKKAERFMACDYLHLSSRLRSHLSLHYVDA